MLFAVVAGKSLSPYLTSNISTLSVFICLVRTVIFIVFIKTGLLFKGTTYFLC